MNGGAGSRLAYAGAVIWLLLTVSLAIWWLIFGLGQAQQLPAIASRPAGRVERMLLWEGVVFVLLLVTGGGLLIGAIHREAARRTAVESFFMAFTHDLKTSLASLQLQAESLREELSAAAANPNLSRLLKDALRLQLQLENSLYYAQPDGRLFLEPIAVTDLVRSVAGDWPELVIDLDGDARVIADERALAGVMRNLLQNAVVHGDARTVAVRVARESGRVRTTVADDGRGAEASVFAALPGPASRPAAYRGSGVGLLISSRLIARMHGQMRVGPTAGRGFVVTIDLPEAA
jgi:signal transduction histidine kinase